MAVSTFNQIKAVFFTLALGSTRLFADGEAAAAAPGQPTLSPFIPLIIIFGIFYFLILRPQQKKTKEHQKYLTQLKKGEMVITNAGMIGTIKSVSDKFVTLEVDKDVCIKMLKSQVLESAESLKETGKDTKKKSLATQTQG